MKTTEEILEYAEYMIEDVKIAIRLRPEYTDVYNQEILVLKQLIKFIKGEDEPEA